MKRHLHLVPVILCGGAGTRLWPLSRKHFPKQFAPIPADGAGAESLFGSTLERARLFEPESIVVVCNEAHRFHVAGEVRAAAGVACSILVEPASRNTAPAIALAALDIQSRHTDGLMLVMPSDHRVTGAAEFSRAVHTAIKAARLNKLVTFGLAPERAETGYGYLRRGEPISVEDQRDEEELYRVADFHEKPDADTAKRWLDEGGYYWNSGMFLFKASVYLRQLETHAPAVHAACVEAYARRKPDLEFVCVERESFEKSPDISVDYAVMERSGEVALVPARFGWSDIGSWDALSSSFERDDQGNRIAGEAVLVDSSDNVVYAQSRLVAAVDMEDCIIAETPDAVLVARRSSAQAVKRLVDELRRQRRAQAEQHRKVYRPWGTYESVDVAEGFQVKRIVVNPKQSLSLQLHHRRSEHWVVVRGEVRVTCGEKQFMLGTNESTYIPVQTRHRLENPGDQPAHLIEVQCGDYLGEDDIVRFEDRYGRSGGEG